MRNKPVLVVALVLAPLVLGGCNALSEPFGDSGNTAGVSHFHVAIDGHDVNLDCTRLDSLENKSGDPTGSDERVLGGTSESTGQQFNVVVPNRASAYRDPAALGRHQLVAYGGDASPDIELFALALHVYDGSRTAWVPCPPEQCGDRARDPKVNYHEMTQIERVGGGEVWKFNQPGGEVVTVPTATFRLSGRYSAVMRPALDFEAVSPRTTIATGDWSLLVTVVDPAAADAAAGDAASELP